MGGVTMLCPECGEENNRVIDTSDSTKGEKILRIRKCLACGFPFPTEEQVPERFAEKYKKTA